MKKTALVIFFIFFASMAFAGSLEDIKWMTEDYPPYNYEEGGVKKGVSIDLLLAIFKKLGLNKGPEAIKIMPWNRGVKTVSSKPDTCLFATTMTDDRRDKLGWKFVLSIPQIIADGTGNYLIAKKSANIKFASREDIAKYGKRIGVVRGDVGEGLLTGSGFPAKKMDQAATPNNLVKKLGKGRIDIISYGYATVVTKMEELGIEVNDYEIVFTFPPAQMGYAFHKDTDPAVLAKFQKALDELTADGTTEAIKAKYKK